MHIVGISLHSPISSTREAYFQLTYGANAMIPIELKETSWKRQRIDEVHNSDNLRVDVDLVYKVQEEA